MSELDFESEPVPGWHDYVVLLLVLAAAVGLGVGIMYGLGMMPWQKSTNSTT